MGRAGQCGETTHRACGEARESRRGVPYVTSRKTSTNGQAPCVDARCREGRAHATGTDGCAAIEARPSAVQVERHRVARDDDACRPPTSPMRRDSFCVLVTVVAAPRGRGRRRSRASDSPCAPVLGRGAPWRSTRSPAAPRRRSPPPRPGVRGGGPLGSNKNHRPGWKCWTERADGAAGEPRGAPPGAAVPRTPVGRDDEAVAARRVGGRPPGRAAAPARGRGCCFRYWQADTQTPAAWSQVPVQFGGATHGAPSARAGKQRPVGAEPRPPSGARQTPSRQPKKPRHGPPG